MTNYIYNGVELPKIPENQSYPYAVIIWDAVEKNYHCVLDKEPIKLTVNNEIASTSTDMSYRLTDGEWEWYGVPIRDSKPIWTSPDDLYSTDGTLYLAASDPIPVSSAPDIEPKAFMAGWRMGQIVRAMRMNSPGITPPEEEKIPIGFSYNGVVLPNIDTVWTDKETYPYATLSVFGIGEIILWSLYFSTSKLHTALYEVEDTHCYSSEAGSAVEYAIDSTGEYASSEEWTLLGEREIVADENFGMASMYFWSSYDILNSTDNSVYLAASDPIPVYE